MSRLIRTVLIVLIVLVIGMSHDSHAQQQLVLVVGQSRLLDVQDLNRVAVGDEQIVDVLALTSYELLLNPLQPGITSLHLWVGKEQQRYQLRVVPDDGTLAKELLALIDIGAVSVWFVEGHLILDGKVSTLAEKQRAESIATAFSDSVISLIQYGEQSLDPQLASEIKEVIGEAIQVSVIHNTIVLEGLLETDLARERAYQMALAFGRPVVNLLQLPEPKYQPEPIEQSELVDPIPEEPSISLVDQLQLALDDGLVVYQWGTTMFVEGTVSSEYEHQRAIAIAKAISEPVVDLIRIVPNQTHLELSPVELSVEQQEPDQLTLDEEQDQKRKEADRVAQEKQLHLTSLRRLINNPEIAVQMIYDQVILEGTVTEQWDQQRAVRLAQIFPYPVINLVRISSQPVPESRPPSPSEIAKAINDPQITVEWINRTLFLEGTVSEEFDKKRALAIGQAFSPNVVDLIRVRQPLVLPVNSEPQLSVMPSTPSVEIEVKTPIPPLDQPEVEEEVTPKVTEDIDEQITLAQFEQELIDDLIHALREPEITIIFHRDTLVLEGMVATTRAKQRAEQIASLYYQPTLSFLEVPEPGEVNSTEQLMRQLNLPDVDVTMVGQRVVLDGVVSDQAEHGRALELAGLYGDVVDLLHVQRPAQVMLQVQVMELAKGVGEEIGITWGSLDCEGFVGNKVQFEEVIRIGSWMMNRSWPLAAQLDALIDQGKAKLLASPSLLTLSGETADFLAGGEIPVAIPMPNAGVTFEWKEYGVKLDMTPLVLEDKIRIALSPEVSSLDWSNGVEVNGILLPAIQTRRVSTTVTVGEGSTVVLGGLIQYEETENIRKVPILADIPIFGSLFRSRQYQERQTELVILITPWIVYQEGVELDGIQ